MIGSFGVVGILTVFIFIIISILGDYSKIFLFLFITSILNTTVFLNLAENSITIPHIIGAIYIFKVGIDILKRSLKLYKSDIYPILFVCFCIIIAFVRGIFIDIKYINFIQLIYLKLAIIIFYCTYILIKNKKINFKDLNKSIKKTIDLLVILCIFQYFNNNIFNNLFRNKINTTFINTLENGDFRVTGTFNEPSMLAIFLCIALFYISFSEEKSSVKIKYIILIISVGLLSRGSTFILVMIMWGIMIFISKIENKQIIKKIFLLISIIIGIYYWNKSFDNILGKEILNLINKLKGEGISGSVRLANLKNNISEFLNHFLVGEGFGVNRSSDLISTLLINTGVLGFSILSIWFLKITKLFNMQQKNKKNVRRVIAIVTVVMLISVPEPYYNFFWIIVAFCY